MGRPIAFVLAAADHGSLIVNRNDYCVSPNGGVFGVGIEILLASSHAGDEVKMARALLDLCRRYRGDAVVALDAGANIGTHTVEWARHMDTWGQVHAFEPQEYVFCALAGNVALNNCFNAHVRRAVLGRQSGELAVPRCDPTRPASYGSLELREGPHNEFIGQAVSYDPAAMDTVPMVAVDDLSLARLDLLKLDVEGMEAEVLMGAAQTLRRCRPVLCLEIIKSDREAMVDLLRREAYVWVDLGQNWLAMHEQDPIRRHLSQTASGGFLIHPDA